MPGKKGKYCPGAAAPQANNDGSPEASIEPSSEASGERGAADADAGPVPSTGPDSGAMKQ